MSKKVLAMVWVSMMVLVLVACGDNKDAQPANGAGASSSNSENVVSNNSTEKQTSDSSEDRTITYLGQDYTVPSKVNNIIIAGAMESMEDALVLGVKPIGATTVGGKFPEMFAKITDGVEAIGEKMLPNIETMLKLKPDIILGSTKFPAESLENFRKVGTTIPVSHISTDWKTNLNLLAELTGKQEEAKQVLEQYQAELIEVKAKVGPLFKDKKVLAIRIRAGNIAIYPADVFFNPSIYAELGAVAPAEVLQAKAQEMISLEKFSEINPDYLFIQFSEEENKDTPKFFEDLQSNPIWTSINAIKNNNVYVNLVDPIAQGGTAYSKISFLEAVKNSNLIQAK
ncbi:ABC transporter substrate-binding protein [Paenibacillus sp. IHBB 10380]|uniref:ABC transporter substrate-binding protein n=1 Tax=Paenibacillus sp. IHBB 10380 TaxID=1566358 RepID=UPI0005CFA028|nr:ABC transporter substrate-binding protein [Paenibacillus sp. IHBB 10380]